MECQSIRQLLFHFIVEITEGITRVTKLEQPIKILDIKLGYYFASALTYTIFYINCGGNLVVHVVPFKERN